jgi:hypothetical protein
VKRALAGVALVLTASVAHAQPAHLSPGEFETGRVEAEAPTIVVLSFGMGDRIFEKFGHTAICLRYHDPMRIPVCFNYGVTDFAEGVSMIWGFLRGEQKFWVEPTSLGSMMSFYVTEDRDIWEQALDLPEAQRRAIEDKLWNDVAPENRTYNYDHFFDNCTTRLRDMIDMATGGLLRAGGDERYPLTFRELGHHGLAELPPLIVLTDFVMGRQVDEHPTQWQAMFHPDILRHMLELKLGATPHLLYKRRGHGFPASGPTDRLPMFALMLLFALPLANARVRDRGQPHLRGAVAGVFAAALGYSVVVIAPVLGGASTVAVAAVFAMPFIFAPGRLAVVFASIPLVFWGLLVWTLVVISSIAGVRWNEVVLVLMPFDAVLPFLGERRQRTYARVRVIGLLLVSALCAIGVLHQPLWLPILTAIVPLGILASDDAR